MRKNILLKEIQSALDSDTVNPQDILKVVSGFVTNAFDDDSSYWLDHEEELGGAIDKIVEARVLLGKMWPYGTK